MKKHAGFTLIELLVVIAIIGILSSVVLASLNSARTKARDAKRISDIKQLQLALELYYDVNGEYPDALSKVSPTYLSVEPSDPTDATSYPYQAYTTTTAPPVAPDQCTEASEACRFYHLGASLEAGSSALSNDSDYDGDTVHGPDSAGCGQESGRKCYDVTP
jgi:prepilin-type N-terminal cleavage/methylation domain-containing protein